MDKPELFSVANGNSRNANLQFLDENSKRMKWSKDGNVIDLGCGDGSFTNIMRQKYIPDTYKTIVACDISENMVNFANERYGDEKTKFTVWDLQDEIPQGFRGTFNHVFSFLTLHWIPNQKKAFQNIYDLLHHGGDCLLTFVGDMPVFDVYLALSETEKWSSWLRNLKSVPFLSPYRKMQNPEEKIEEIMKNVGYKNVDIKCEEYPFVYNNVEEFGSLIRALDPFHMPHDVREEFMKDVLEMTQDMGHFKEIHSSQSGPELVYYLRIIVVYACK